LKFSHQVLAAVLLAAAHAHAATPPPIAAFFDNSAFNGAMLSPDGRYLAAFIGANDQRDGLAVVELDTLKATMVAQFSDTDIGKAQWVNNERLMFSTADKASGQRDLRYAPGLYVVDRDGKHFRQLALRRNEFIRSNDDNRDLLPWHTFMLDQHGAQNSDFVYVVDAGFSNDIGATEDLLRLNTRNGKAEPVEHPGLARDWLLDQDGEPRLLTTRDKDNAALLYRDPASQQWRTLVSYKAFSLDNSFTPLAFGPDGTLYVVSNAGRDTSALYRYDLKNQKLAPQHLIELDGFDFKGHLILSKQRLLGVRIHADAQGTVWLDPAMKALQEQIDQRLPGAVNLLTPPARPETAWVLVESSSDKQPRRTLVYNTESKRLSEVGRLAPQIKTGDMGPRELVHYKARDGLQIPAWLTLPPAGAQKNLPLVMLVHGGPWVRGGSWDWNADAEFLASRGYAVLEPEFRGSTGYGKQHFLAGLKQWGLKMQDDIADGARWAVAQGYADAGRICIAGASYGGYATLMGLIKDPDLYKCGINWVGVSDINLMYDSGWFYSSDASNDWKQYGMPLLIGDQVKDAEQLKATSPLLQASRIKQPLLLAYGGADRRVPLNHGLKLRDAVKPGNPNVEWVEYGEEGHGWSLPKNRIDFWGRVERFLDKNIGKP
jgi:dipeptidyl aminopeptidase/acylaminoacyl peptidase